MFSWWWRIWLAPMDKEWASPLGDSYRQLQFVLGVILLSLMAATVSIVFLTWRTNNLPLPRYVAIQPEQSPRAISPLTYPAMTNNKVRSWASRALKDTFSMNFYNMEKRMDLASTYYTSRGWSALLASFEDREVTQSIIRNQLDVVLTPTAIPTIVQRSIIDGLFYWRLEVPVIIVYTGSKDVRVEDSIISLHVGQVPTLDDPEALAIYSIRQHSSSQEMK